MRSQTLFSRRSRMIIRIKLRATHITLLVYILFYPRRLGQDTQVTQLSHSILPCGALYKLDPLERKGLYLVRFSKGCVHKHFSVAVVEWSDAITWSQKKKKKKKKKKKILIICTLLKIVAVYNMKCKEYKNKHNLLKRAMIAVWNVICKEYIYKHNLLKSAMNLLRIVAVCSVWSVKNIWICII